MSQLGRNKISNGARCGGRMLQVEAGNVERPINIVINKVPALSLSLSVYLSIYSSLSFSYSSCFSSLAHRTLQNEEEKRCPFTARLSLIFYGESRRDF